MWGLSRKGCRGQKPEDHLTLNAEDGEALRARGHRSNLPRADVERGEWVIRTYFYVVFALQEANLSAKRLRSLLFGKRPEPSPSPEASSAAGQAESDGPHASAVLEAEADGAGATGHQAPPGASPRPARATPTGGHRPGTGCLGAAAYAGATRVECRHAAVAVGQRCPVCGQGPLDALPAGVEVRIDGHALRSALRYELEKLRCSACGAIFTAGVPDGVGEEQYSAQARAVLAVSRYSLGVPGYRWQGDQAMLGGPVPEATPWDQIEVVGDCADKGCAQMERAAAQGELIFHDDPAVRILSLIKENRDLVAAAHAQGWSTTNERTGMHTTALVGQGGEHTAMLYDSSRGHAGENLQGLLDKREAGRDKPLAMSDALASNAVADASRLIRCHCLAHGRRKFSDREAVLPHACEVVREVLSQVFDHDEQARKEPLSPQARLAYPQAQSQPLMDELKRWLDRPSDDHLVEPNSALGKAMGYMPRHWVTLTKFLSVPGAPLDHNLAERALKLFIRQRNTSLCDKSTQSAYLARVLTSLIATCLYAGVNAVAYRVALPEHRREGCADPAAGRPWA